MARRPVSESWVRCTAFEGSRRVATGDLVQVVRKVKRKLDSGDCTPIVIFDDVTSQRIELDFRGSLADVLERLPKPTAGTPAIELPEPEVTADNAPRGPGRPKLGVIAREVTLLPRHWEWLNRQPGGASVALRKLVEEARRTHAGKDSQRESREAVYRFMSAMAGDNQGFEEATRALFAGNAERFEQHIATWPEDIRAHAKKLAAACFG